MLIKTISLFLLLTTIIFFNACSSDSVNKTPKCSDLAIIDKLSKILRTDSRKAIIDIATVRKKIDLTKQNKMRTCRARVDYVHSVDGVSKNNKVFYTVALSETEKYIVSVVDQ